LAASLLVQQFLRLWQLFATESCFFRPKNIRIKFFMDGLIIFLGSITTVFAIWAVVVVIRNKEVFFPPKNHSN